MDFILRHFITWDRLESGKGDERGVTDTAGRRPADPPRFGSASAPETIHDFFYYNVTLKQHIGPYKPGAKFAVMKIVPDKLVEFEFYLYDTCDLKTSHKYAGTYQAELRPNRDYT